MANCPREASMPLSPPRNSKEPPVLARSVVSHQKQPTPERQVPSPEASAHAEQFLLLLLAAPLLSPGSKERRTAGTRRWALL